MKKILLAVFASLALAAGVASAIELSNPVITGGSANGMVVTMPYRSTPVISTATSYTVTSTDEVLIFNASGGATLTLPSAAANVGRVLWILTVASQTVASGSSNVIPCTSTTAGTAILAGTAGKWAMLVADGVAGTSNWRCIAAN